MNIPCRFLRKKAAALGKRYYRKIYFDRNKTISLTDDSVDRIIV